MTDSDVTEPTALVANLPYNVAVPVLLHLLETFPSIRRVLVMVQLEVADRLAAQPGSKVYGVPSVKAGFYGKVSKAGTIGKNVFGPRPILNPGWCASMSLKMLPGRSPMSRGLMSGRLSTPPLPNAARPSARHCLATLVRVPRPRKRCERRISIRSSAVKSLP